MNATSGESPRILIFQTKYTGIFGDIVWAEDTARQQLVVDIKRVSFKGGTAISETMVIMFIRVFA